MVYIGVAFLFLLIWTNLFKFQNFVKLIKEEKRDFKSEQSKKVKKYNS